jgi:hypothetical protein
MPDWAGWVSFCVERNDLFETGPEGPELED